jgi:hypothetical protein
MSEEYLSLRAFAALPEVNVSHITVKKYKDQGKLPTSNDGLIPKEAGLKAWKTCRVAGYEKAAVAGKKFGGDPKKTKNHGPARSLDSEYEFEGEDADINDPKWTPRLNKAKALVQEQMAIKRKFENEVEQGRYVLKSEVRQEASELAGTIKQKLISIAPIIAVSAEGKTALQIQKVVELHLNEVLKQLQEMEK